MEECVMRITKDIEERTEYEYSETAGTARNCLPFAEGFEEGFQALPVVTEEGRWAVGVYDANLVVVGWLKCDS